MRPVRKMEAITTIDDIGHFFQFFSKDIAVIFIITCEMAIIFCSGPIQDVDCYLGMLYKTQWSHQFPGLFFFFLSDHTFHSFFSFVTIQMMLVLTIPKAKIKNRLE